MTCHSQIWTNAALLAPVRAAWLMISRSSWHRITNLPDYVYFNHSHPHRKGRRMLSATARSTDAVDVQGKVIHDGLLPGLP